MKFKEFIKKNYKILLLVFLGVIVLGISIFLVVHFCFKSEPTEEEKLTKYLEDMGADYYEGLYDRLGGDLDTKTDFLKKYASIGIKIDLENLAVYDNKKNEEKIKEFVNSETNTKCDQNKTAVSIYPKSPYGVKDYEVKATLSCGFNED